MTTSKLTWEHQWEKLSVACHDIFPAEEFKDKLKTSVAQERPLRVKLGVDPTGPDLHLGHMVPFRKLRAFQDLGHLAVLIIGDTTAQIGDPSGKTASRPSLTLEQTRQNAQKYLEQAYKVIDPDKTEVHYQTEWFSEKPLLEFLRSCSVMTMAKILSHETFSNRIEAGQSLGVHEILYPILQGLDSVEVKADIELGGVDQTFNILVGRDFQKAEGMPLQCAMVLPIILGTDGHEKMSKSLDNYIGVLESCELMFGKVMSIPDTLMPEYARYASNFSPKKAEQFCSQINGGELHPNEAKKQLAASIVELYFNEKEAVKARAQFEQVFSQKGLPDQMPEIAVDDDVSLLEVLDQSGLFSSRGEMRRLIKQSAVGVYEGVKLSDEKAPLPFGDMGELILKIGKRKFLKVRRGQSCE